MKTVLYHLLSMLTLACSLSCKPQQHDPSASNIPIVSVVDTLSMHANNSSSSPQAVLNQLNRELEDYVFKQKALNFDSLGRALMISTQDTHTQLTFHTLFAAYLKQQKRYDSCRQVNEKVQQMLQQAEKPDTTLWLKSYILQAKLERIDRTYKLAVTTLDQAAKLITAKIQTQKIAVDFYLLQSASNLTVRAYRAAQDAAHHALEIPYWEGKEADKLYAKVLEALSVAEAFGGKAEQAQSHILEAETILNSLQVTPIEKAKFYQYKAYILSNGLNWNKVIQYNEKALRLYKQADSAGTRETRARICHNLSMQYVAINQYEQGIQRMRQAINLFTNELMLASCYTNLGRFELDHQHRVDTALFYIDKAKEIIIRMKGQQARELIIPYQYLGKVFTEKEQFEDAYLNFELARSLTKDAYGMNHYMYSNIQANIAETQFKEGKLEDALLSIQKGFYSFDPTTDTSQYIPNPSLDSFPSYKNHLLSLLHQKGDVLQTRYKQTKDLDALHLAYQTDSLGAVLIDRMHMDILKKHDQKSTFDLQFAHYKQAIQTAEMLAEQTGESTPFKQAFTYIEKTKSTQLLSNMIQAKSRQQLERSGNEGEHAALYIQKIRYFEDQLERTQLTDNQEITLNKNVDNLKDSLFDYTYQYDLLLRELEQKGSDAHVYENQIKVASLSEVQQTLKPDEALIEYFVGDKLLYRYLITQDTVVLRTQVIDQKFEQQIRSLHEWTSDRSKSKLEGASKQKAFQAFLETSTHLYEKLLGGLNLPAATQHLIMIPDGIVSSFPFGLLIDPEKLKNSIDQHPTQYASLPYLMKDYSIREAYSASILVQTILTPSTSSAFLAYAPGNPAKTVKSVIRGQNQIQQTDCKIDVAAFNALGKNHLEADLAAEKMNGKAIKGSLAKEAHFKQYAPTSSILHLGMHGFINHCNPMRSGLIFHTEEEKNGPPIVDISAVEDNVLYCSEIYRMQLQAELIVLSACETGLGEFKKGEGVMSLARAFAYAGSPNVVMTKWNADDEAAHFMMKRFYHHLEAGKGKSEALNQAKLDYLNDSDTFKHPYYWAMFSLIGDNEPVNLPTPYPFWIVGLVLSMLLAGGIGWYRYVKNAESAN